MKKILSTLKENIVFCIFIVLVAACIILGKQSPAYVVGELISRFSRNSISILSLIVPVLCGTGMNFGIVVGAMAGELGLILVLHWHIGGVPGILLSMFIGSLFAIFFGWLTGRVYNKTKGQETLTGWVLGYFAFGLFNLILINLFGKVIPFKDEVLMLSSGVGIRDTIGMAEMNSAFDNALKVPLLTVIQWGTWIVFGLALFLLLYRRFRMKKSWPEAVKSSIVYLVFGILFIILINLTHIKSVNAVLKFTRVPVLTWILIAFVTVLIAYITNTRWGQKVRVIGQNRKVATASGINVDRIRIEAVIVSTVLACWGQIISLQNLGTMNTYTAHEQVGTYAVAALLVGGASLNKATVKQAYIGCILFHLLYFMAPIAARNVFNNTMVGEYFRVFLSYGIIVVSLIMYAWNRGKADRAKGK